MLNSGNILPTQETIPPAPLIKENQQLPLAMDDDGNQTEELKYRLARPAGLLGWPQKPGDLMSWSERSCLWVSRQARASKGPRCCRELTSLHDTWSFWMKLLPTHLFIPSVFHSSTQEILIEDLLCARFCTTDYKMISKPNIISALLQLYFS